jgi:hypothetical protein
LVDAAEERMQRQPDEPQPAGPVRKIEAQAARIETGTRAEPEAGDLVFVVAHKEKRGFARELLTFKLDLQIEKREPPERLDGRPKKGGPLPARQAFLLSLAARNDLRVDAETRIVDEDPPVHFARVDGSRVPCFDRLHRSLEIERDAEVFGEMIQRANREDAQNLVGASQL